MVTISGGSGSSGNEVNPNFAQMETQFDESLNIPTQHFSSNASTYESVRDYITSQGENQPVVIVGYSWGGGKALEIAAQLEENGIAVDSVITIDPFQRGISSTDTSPEGISNNGININLYQINPAPIVGSRGSTKEGMLNLDVGGINNLGSSITHSNIISNNYVQNLVVGTVNVVHSSYISRTWGSYGYTDSKSVSQRVSLMRKIGSSSFQKLARSRGLM